MRYILPVYCALALVGAGTAVAQEVSVGTNVRASGEVPVRTAPPSGFPLGPGEVMFTGRPGQTFSIVDTKTVQALAYTDRWVKVRSADGRLGWAYWGRNSQDSPNFRVE